MKTGQHLKHYAGLNFLSGAVGELGIRGQQMASFFLTSGGLKSACTKPTPFRGAGDKFPGKILENGVQLLQFYAFWL